MKLKPVIPFEPISTETIPISGDWIASLLLRVTIKKVRFYITFTLNIYIYTMAIMAEPTVG